MTQKSEQAQKQASSLPPVIAAEKDGKRIEIFRLRDDAGERYVLAAGEDDILTLAAWEYHVLCALFSHGGDTYETLLGNANDRFGAKLARRDIETLFDRIWKGGLFDETESRKHPLTAPFAKGEGKVGAQEEAPVSESKQEHLFWQHKTLCDPTGFLEKIRPLLSYGGALAYAVPFLTLCALFVIFNHVPDVKQGFFGVLESLTFVTGILISLFTVNILAAFTSSAVAYAYGGSVKAVDMVLFYGFLPRFIPRITDTEKFSRTQTLWFHAAPLLVRLGIFSICLLLWFYGRSLGGILPPFFAALSFMAALSFLLISCPFYKSSGYALLTTFLEEPKLREKAFLAFQNRWKKNAYARVDSAVLAFYGIASILFILVLALSILGLLHAFLAVNIGGKALAVIVLPAGFVGYKLWGKVREIDNAYDRRQQFERWRRHAIPESIGEEEAKKEKEKTRALRRLTPARKAALGALALLLLLPYPYRATGRVELLPAVQQQISTDIAGIVAEVYFDGGETVAKDALIATLAVQDKQAELAVYKGKLAEQQARIAWLKALPMQEDIRVAQEKLNSATLSWSYSNAKCERQQELYDSKAISLDDLEAVLKVCEMDRQKILEAQTELDRVTAGAAPEEIAAAEAALPPIQAQIASYEDQIRRSEFRMPFNGKIATLHLQEKKGAFLERGEPLALVEDDSGFKIVVELPETDAPFIQEGGPVSVRLAAMPGKVFRGRVKTINASVEDKSYGKVISAIVALENGTNELKSGMTGYAKVSGKNLMGWQIFTRSLYRFVTVEMWAWTP